MQNAMVHTIKATQKSTCLEVADTVAEEDEDDDEEDFANVAAVGSVAEGAIA